MGFTVYGVPHEHFSGGSCFSMKKWVNLMWPMYSQIKLVSSLLVLLGSGFLLEWVVFDKACCGYFNSIAVAISLSVLGWF